MSLVDYTTEGAVGLIRLQRPPVNALNSELIADIDAAITEASSPDIRAVVITGETHFAAGADITRFKAAFDSGNKDALAGELGGVVDRLETLEKPTIAAVRGYALGGGLELAMGADYRYLASDAKVGQPEIRLGIIPGAGGTQRLTRLVGFQRAKELNMSGRHVPADEALTLGIADKVVSGEDLLGVAMGDAARWAEGPTRAYWAVKKAMGAGWGVPLADGLRAERDAFQEVFSTQDAEIGVTAFLAKERPTFGGS